MVNPLTQQSERYLTRPEVSGGGSQSSAKTNGQGNAQGGSNTQSNVNSNSNSNTPATEHARR